MAEPDQLVSRSTKVSVHPKPIYTTRRSLDIPPSRSSILSNTTPTPSSSVPSTPLFSARPSSPKRRTLHSRDSNTFLTALATQERRVLELKEELQKAGSELETLKKQWAVHETAKKQGELRHVEQLQPLLNSLGGRYACHNGKSNQFTTGLDKHKSMSFGMRSSQRKVFSGSRQTRALSLLSLKEVPNHSHRCNNRSPRDHARVTEEAVVPPIIPELTNNAPISSASHKSEQSDVILETSKQIVGDFRQGLSTFWEDLKQVTVGDEAAAAGADLRNQSTVLPAIISKRPTKEKTNGIRENENSRTTTIFEMEVPVEQQQTEVSGSNRRMGGPRLGVLVGSAPTTNNSRHSNGCALDCSDSDDEGWDNWDTPITKPEISRQTYHSHESGLLASPFSDKSSPGTSLR